MRVFVAGATGAIGMQLVPRLVAAGHEVHGMTRSESKQATIRELKNVHQPALIVHPREDDYADLNNAWYIQRHLKGLVDMCVLDDSYHVVTIDRQRNIVVDRTIAFVETVAKRAKDRPARPAAKAGLEDAPQTITVKAVAV